MTTPKIFIFDGESGEELVRDFNAQELAQNKKDLEEANAQTKAEAEEAKVKESAAEKLLALGIDPKALGLYGTNQ
jgi:tryptophanyl-tRNA synthetase